MASIDILIFSLSLFISWSFNFKKALNKETPSRTCVQAYNLEEVRGGAAPIEWA